MKKKLIIVLAIAIAIFILDHASKWWIVENVPQGDEITVIDGYFDIVHGRNTGAAFGMLQGWDSPYRDAFFYTVAVIAFGFMYNYLRNLRDNDYLAITALGLITGGAIGNIVDRFARGSVVDFLSFHIKNSVWHFELLEYHFTIPLVWPAFNVADSAITCAVFLLVIFAYRSPTKTELI